MSKRKSKKNYVHIPTVIMIQTRSAVTIRRIDVVQKFAYKRPEHGVEDSYVYFVFFNSELIYIGKGKGDRWKHTQSSSTHNPFLRKAIKSSGINNGNDDFNPARYKTLIVKDGLPDTTAFYIEQKLIKKFKPLGNIDGNPAYLRSPKGASRLAQSMRRHADVSKPSNQKDALKKSKATVKRVKNRKQQWRKENEERLAEEDLDLAHLQTLMDKGFW